MSSPRRRCRRSRARGFARCGVSRFGSRVSGWSRVQPETGTINQKPAASSPATIGSPFASHPDSALEWWYWTGHLSDAKGRAYGFQVTFFRLRDFHLAHFAWTDVAAKRFTFDEKAHLGLPGIAGASED